MTKAEHRKLIAGLADYIVSSDFCPAVAAFLCRAVAADMHNRVPPARARNTSQAVTPAVRRRIRDLHQTDPALPQHEIAKLAGVNQGRVNEVLRGIRR